MCKKRVARFLNKRATSDTTRVAVEPSILVFSGGTAMNQMCRSLQTITDDIAYVMPITGTQWMAHVVFF